MSGASLRSAAAVPALRCRWLAPLMSSAQALPGLPLYFATPATDTSMLRDALAVPSLREGWGVGCGKRRNHSPLYHQRGERSRQWGAWRSEVKGEEWAKPIPEDMSAAVCPAACFASSAQTPKHTTASNQTPSTFKRTTP